MKYTAQVIKGQGRGKTLGFPTFNLIIPINWQDAFGIYACWVWLERSDAPRSNRLALARRIGGKRPNSSLGRSTSSARSSVADVGLGGEKYAGALHFGPVPTFGQKQTSLEIFILDYTSQKPIEKITFEPVKYLRAVKNFTSATFLKRQIAADVANVRELLNQ